MYGFWPNILTVFLHWFTNGNFFAQAFAVGIGVFGGMWADKKLQEHESIKKTLGALEVIDSELQSNIKAVTDIKDQISSRPSFAGRVNYSSDKVIEMIKDEEQWVGRISKQIIDRGYYAVLPTISTLSNRKLFEKIVNSYLKLRNTRLVLGLAIMDSFTGLQAYTDQQKSAVVRMGDKHFNKLSEGLLQLKENFQATDKSVIAEEKRLLNRLK